MMDVLFNMKKICEICQSTYKASYYKKYKLTVCNKHRLQLYFHGEIKENKVPLKDQPCAICGKILKSMNSKNGISYCHRHYYQISKYGIPLVDKNKIDIKEDHAEIILYENRLTEIGRVLIDIDDIDKIKRFYWALSAENYAVTRFHGSTVFMHNLILKIGTENHLTMVPDHINRNRLDNRKINLRIVDRKTNGFNKGTQSNNTSGYPGVSFSKRSRKYRSYIKINNKQIHLGYFHNIEDAINARKEAEIIYFGEIINREYDCNTVFKYKGNIENAN